MLIQPPVEVATPFNRSGLPAEWAATYGIPLVDAWAVVNRIADFVSSNEDDEVIEPSLPDAVDAGLPATEAVRLLLTADLAVLGRNLMFWEYGAGILAPLHTNGELADHLSGVMEYQSVNRQELIETGASSAEFPGPAWLSPLLSVMHPDEGWVGDRGLYWLRDCREHGLVLNCWPGDAALLVAQRGRLHRIRERILTSCTEALRTGDPCRVWPSVLRSLAGFVTQPALRLLSRIRLAGEPEDACLSAGGVDDLLLVVGHVESELLFSLWKAMTYWIRTTFGSEPPASYYAVALRDDIDVVKALPSYLYFNLRTLDEYWQKRQQEMYADLALLAEEHSRHWAQLLVSKDFDREPAQSIDAGLPASVGQHVVGSKDTMRNRGSVTDTPRRWEAVLRVEAESQRLFVNATPLVRVHGEDRPKPTNLTINSKPVQFLALLALGARLPSISRSGLSMIRRALKNASAEAVGVEHTILALRGEYRLHPTIAFDPESAGLVREFLQVK